MALGRMALGEAKSERDVDPTLRPDSRLAFRRPGRQTHGAHRTQRIIFADVGGGLGGGVLDPRAAGRGGSACGASWWTSIWSGSMTAWFSSTAGAARGAGGGGRSEQSRLLAK